MSDFDLVVKNGKVVTPYVGVTDADIGILDGKISAIETSIDSSRAKEVIDAEGKAIANRILSASLTDRILQEKGIEATLKLAESPNAKVIVVGSGENGLPIILGNN